MRFKLMIAWLALLAAGCTFTVNGTPIASSPLPPSNTNAPAGGETATVNFVVDGDTIDVTLNGQRYRVRYVGINTPESDEVCYREATNANAALVNGKTVTLVKDTSNTDRFDRLLRYVYVDGIFVNAQLVAQGWAEVVSYPPDTAYFETFKSLEIAAAQAGLGCHPTGIFNDGRFDR